MYMLGSLFKFIFLLSKYIYLAKFVNQSKMCISFCIPMVCFYVAIKGDSDFGHLTAMESPNTELFFQFSIRLFQRLMLILPMVSLVMWKQSRVNIFELMFFHRFFVAGEYMYNSEAVTLIPLRLGQGHRDPIEGVNPFLKLFFYLFLGGETSSFY